MRLQLFTAWIEPFFKQGQSNVLLYPGPVTGINMDEEIAAPIVIAIVTGYDGITQPRLGRFETTNSLDLNLYFALNADNEWEMIVNKTQDYEQVSMRLYIFAVEIDGVSVSVQISINNIFDNPPVVTALSNPCSIKVN